MTDPRRPDGGESNRNPNRPHWSQPTEPVGNHYRPEIDPAYAGQYTYPSYLPPSSANPTEPLPPYWTQTQFQAPGQPPDQGVPEPPRSPRWLWLIAGVTVVLVVGLVIALVIVNGASKQDTVVAPLPSMPAPTTTGFPLPTTRTPTTTTTPSPLPTTTATTSPTPSTRAPVSPGGTDTVVYSVTGRGRAISITYVDTGGLLQIEFNVVLPWSREVTLTSPAATSASVTVLNVGREVTCTVRVNGAPVRQRTGTGLTICASAG
ncbi:MmpS family transport accessory protein [Mycolicibacterium palauense]|uniref:MmpS family transport accessory protein n=1 Tax=Mycolicibacterium palauense TaxID=2034511 RepID=UPI000BFECDB3|nr:MmpS family transport accessory protein [Mycolicibacterium palauense]